MKRYFFAGCLIFAASSSRAADYCNKIEENIAIMDKQIVRPAATEGRSEEFFVAVDRMEEATREFNVCAQSGGLSLDHLEKGIDGLITQLKIDINVYNAAGILGQLGKPAIRALPDLKIALEREKSKNIPKQFNGPRVERALVGVIGDLTKLQMSEK